MRQAALAFALVLSACGIFAPRVGTCAAPQHPAYAGWRVVMAGTGYADDDVWLVMEGTSGNVPCRVLVETERDCAWRVTNLSCPWPPEPVTA